MTIDPSAFDWQPYAVHGRRHPGVWIAGLERSGGRELTAKLEPNGFTNTHTHSGKEIITVLRGCGEITIDGTVRTLKAGDVIIVPSLLPHTLKNAADEDLFVHAAFEPSFFVQETVLK